MDAHYRSWSFRESQRRISSENPSVCWSILSSVDAGASPPSGQGAAPPRKALQRPLDVHRGHPHRILLRSTPRRARQWGAIPDAMVPAIWVIVYLCDRSGRAVFYLVWYDALCARLMAMEYVDMAELCLIALKKISIDHTVVCLNAGAILAVLNYIDFFSGGVMYTSLCFIGLCMRLCVTCARSVYVSAPKYECLLFMRVDLSSLAIIYK